MGDLTKSLKSLDTWYHKAQLLAYHHPYFKKYFKKLLLLLLLLFYLKKRRILEHDASFHTQQPQKDPHELEVWNDQRDPSTCPLTTTTTQFAQFEQEVWNVGAPPNLHYSFTGLKK